MAKKRNTERLGEVSLGDLSIGKTYTQMPARIGYASAVCNSAFGIALYHATEIRTP